MTNKELGIFIRNLRTEKGFTQSELAQKLGLTPVAVSKWERGVSKPRPEILLQLSEILGFNVDDLLEKEKTDQKLPDSTPVQKKKTVPIVATIITLFLVALCVFVLLVLKKPSSTPDEVSVQTTTTSVEQSRETSSQNPSSSDTSSKKQTSSKTSSKTSSNTSSKNTTSSNASNTTSKAEDDNSFTFYSTLGIKEDGWRYYFEMKYEDTTVPLLDRKKIGGIYKSKLDGSEKICLIEVEGYFKCIRVIDGWLYYRADAFGKGGLYRIRTDGTQNTLISYEECRAINFVGDKIYYLTDYDNVVNVVNNDGRNGQRFSPLMTAKWMVILENTMYTSDGKVFQQINLDGTGYKSSPLTDVDYFIVSGEYFYYSRVNDKMTTYYRSRIDMTETIELVTVNGTYARQSIFVENGWFYFAKEDSRLTFHRIKIDGTGEVERTNRIV